MRWIIALVLTLCCWGLSAHQPAHANAQCVTLERATRAAPESYIFCAAIAEDNRIYTNLRPNEGGAWTGWRARSDAVVGDVTCSAFYTLSTSRFSDWFRVDCYARGGDGVLRQVVDGGDATSTDAGRVASPLIGDPSCTSMRGLVTCFGRNGDNALQVNGGVIGRGWTGWRNLGGVVTSDPECVTPADGGMPHCFVRNTDRAISAIGCSGRTATSTCTPWVNGDGILESPLSCVGQNTPRPDGGRTARFDCFVRGTDNTLFQNRFTESRFGGWQRTSAGRFAGAPSCVVTGVDRYLCAARGEDNRMQFTRFDGARWSDWTAVTTDTITGDPHCTFSGVLNETSCVARHAATAEMQLAVISTTGGWRSLRVAGLRMRE